MRTSCHGCIQMCPAIAYLKDGVVVRLEGDPEAPVSRGSLCIKGLNQLHTMYSPRRILHPLRRAGERGENKWEVISWDEAITEAATHIKDAIDQYGNYAFFASVGGGGSYSFMEAMTLPMAFGSRRCSSRLRPVLSAPLGPLEALLRRRRPVHRGQRRAGDLQGERQ